MENIYFKVSNLTTSYKDFSIKEIDFDLSSGDMLGLIGKSGSGKSTLIKTVIGLKKPKTGTISFYINDKKVPVENNVGYSSQENSLFPFLTLKENIMVYGKLMGLKKSEILERKRILLAKFKLENDENKKIVEFSGGMAKRADIIVTLLHNPAIIILDEPFNGLDFMLTRFLWEQIKDLAKEGKIIIVSSHFLTAIQKNCNKIGFISEGHFYNHNEMLARMKQRNLSSLQELFVE